jgi:hypothetical protein
VSFHSFRMLRLRQVQLYSKAYTCFILMHHPWLFNCIRLAVTFYTYIALTLSCRWVETCVWSFLPSQSRCGWGVDRCCYNDFRGQRRYRLSCFCYVSTAQMGSYKIVLEIIKPYFILLLIFLVSVRLVMWSLDL